DAGARPVAVRLVDPPGRRDHGRQRPDRRNGAAAVEGETRVTTVALATQFDADGSYSRNPAFGKSWQKRCASREYQGPVRIRPRGIARGMSVAAARTGNTK